MAISKKTQMWVGVAAVAVLGYWLYTKNASKKTNFVGDKTSTCPEGFVKQSAGQWGFTCKPAAAGVGGFTPAKGK